MSYLSSYFHETSRFLEPPLSGQQSPLNFAPLQDWTADASFLGLTSLVVQSRGSPLIQFQSETDGVSMCLHGVTLFLLLFFSDYLFIYLLREHE